MQKFYIETYGCQMNESDSELVKSILVNAGFNESADLNGADVIIFNTCSVRQHAEDRVLGRITNENSRKKKNPKLKIGVIGCMAQRVGEELFKLGIGVDFVAGVDQYQDIPEIIFGRTSNTKIQTDTNQIYDLILPQHTSSVCGLVTIMRGCNNYCSYCIVPYVRGRERSRSVNRIIDDINAAYSKGIRDVTLLGQNVNSYKFGEINFPKLLRLIDKETSIQRIRFVTSHPKDLSDELIDVMSDNNKVCEHIHLPMQSGDNNVLQRMNRNYTIEHYMHLVTKLRSKIPNVGLTTDLIAGFPGETESQFENTLKVMERIRFDYAFCFKYSERSGTAAADFTDQLDEDIRLSRLQKMIDLQRVITKEKYNEQIGKQTEVLAEGYSKHGGNQLSGKTRDFKICVFEGTENQIGNTIKVEVVKATAGTLIARQT